MLCRIAHYTLLDTVHHNSFNPVVLDNLKATVEAFQLQSLKIFPQMRVFFTKYFLILTIKPSIAFQTKPFLKAAAAESSLLKGHKSVACYLRENERWLFIRNL